MFVAIAHVLNVILRQVLTQAPVYHQHVYQYVVLSELENISAVDAGRLLAVLADVAEVEKTILSVTAVLHDDIVPPKKYQYVELSEIDDNASLAKDKLLPVLDAYTHVLNVILSVFAVNAELVHQDTYP